MKTTRLDSGQEFIEVTLERVLNLSGVYRTDSDLEKDMKIQNWINGRSYRCVLYNADTYDAEVSKAQQEGIQILITKE